MRQGGVAVVFEQQVDPNTGRLDVTTNRVADVSGASGTGLVAAVLVDAVGVGTATLSLSGSAMTPAGAPAPLLFAPSLVTVR